ncbi:MAG: hypothetical protein VKL23_07430 [Cyanobacteriota bacterium]|jgi:hypothetical protein|nr:hypothetical protein [Cyanobacteriota bacterium]
MSSDADLADPVRVPRLEQLARVADLCLKPRIHAVRLIQPAPPDQQLDCTIRLEARNDAGERLPEHDLELELFHSGNRLTIMMSWVADPETPMLWYGNHPVWMQGKSGEPCPRPEGGLPLEALCRRLLALLASG